MRALGLASLALAGCASFDPAVPYRLPDDDWAVGVSGAVVWDESESPLTGGPLGGLDVSYLDDVFGLHAGLRLQHEGRGERLAGLVEATAWYVLELGAGLRYGGMVSDAGVDAGEAVPDRALDLTFIVALPIPVWRDCVDRAGALVIAPYARPGLRLTGGDPDADDVRGFHEIGITVRWTSFAF